MVVVVCGGEVAVTRVEVIHPCTLGVSHNIGASGFGAIRPSVEQH